MLEIHQFLRDILLPSTQFLSMLIGIRYIIRLKASYWKWFSIYLILIFAQEFFWLMKPNIQDKVREAYYVFFGIPIQYLFFFWLYALKSLKKKGLFLSCTALFLSSIVVTAVLKKQSEVIPIIVNLGNILLIYLFILEFMKQTKNDSILKFKENKMFYINIGLVLFYLANYPYVVFAKELFLGYKDLWNIYYSYFLISNCLMYLLFAASFIWGKEQ